jgi:hypothetical protein
MQNFIKDRLSSRTEAMTSHGFTVVAKVANSSVHGVFAQRVYKNDRTDRKT